MAGAHSLDSGRGYFDPSGLRGRDNCPVFKLKNCWKCGICDLVMVVSPLEDGWRRKMLRLEADDMMVRVRVSPSDFFQLSASSSRFLAFLYRTVPIWWPIETREIHT